MNSERRPPAFYFLAAFFALFVAFLYGPTFVIFVLSFQGPTGGLTFPMNGVSLHWFERLWRGGGIVDISGAFKRSLALGLIVMLLTMALSLMAGLAFRKRFRGANVLFFVTIASLIVPSIVTSLGIALEFRIFDDLVKNHGPTWLANGFQTSMGNFTSGLGAHLTWTLPFGLLVMFAIFNRFDPRYEEAARDLGATPWQTLRHVIIPIVAPSLIGVGLFGFTLSWDEIARSSQTMGEHNTLPMELQALTTTVTNPDIYALGTATTGVSFAVIALALGFIAILGRRQARHGSDAGKA